MKNYRINRIYAAFALFCCACGYCVVNSNPYQNALILGLAFIVWLLIVAIVFDNPSKGEERTINKLSQSV